jgi:hypothetical protein
MCKFNGSTQVTGWRMLPCPHSVYIPAQEISSPSLRPSLGAAKSKGIREAKTSLLFKNE